MLIFHQPIYRRCTRTLCTVCTYIRALPPPPIREGPSAGIPGSIVAIRSYVAQVCSLGISDTFILSLHSTLSCLTSHALLQRSTPRNAYQRHSRAPN